MTVEVSQQVQSCGELSVGDQIEAWHNGKLFHRGEVVRTVEATDLFWILDERTGTRRLIDAEALVIVRVPVPEAKYGSGAPLAEQAPRASEARSAVSGLPPVKAPATAPPASHVPLFQAPALVP
jgi:hypothetical protein